MEFDAGDRRTKVKQDRPERNHGPRSTTTGIGLTSRKFGGARADALAHRHPSYNNRDDLTGLTCYSDLAGSTLVGTTSYAYDDVRGG